MTQLLASSAAAATAVSNASTVGKSAAVAAAIAEGTAAASSADQALISSLAAEGARIRLAPKVREDGVRGVFAMQDMDAGDTLCWVPNSAVLSIDTIDEALKRDVQAAVQTEQCTPAESPVYTRMVSLVAGLLAEKAKGTGSSFRSYIKALPAYPPTVNTFDAAERDALGTMNGGLAVYKSYEKLVNMAFQVVQASSSCCASKYSFKEVEDTFYFVLSRMSHLKLIPLCDLANAAQPGEENASILVDDQFFDGREGCALVLKRPVKAGEEVMIDYNHHDAVGMMLAYGCTLNLERSRSVTRIQFALPVWLQDLPDAKLCESGAQLHESEEAGLEETVLLLLRMAALGSGEEAVRALQYGYFIDERKGPPEKVSQWNGKVCNAYSDIANFCAQRLRDWEEKIGPKVARVDERTEPGRLAVVQYETDRQLLRRCEKVLRERAVALRRAVSPNSPCESEDEDGSDGGTKDTI